MSGEAGSDITDAVAIYDPNGPMAIIAFLAFLVVALGFWYRHFRASQPRPKYMRAVRYGATFMAIGYICRFSRRDGINAWSWLFETLCILLSPCAFLAQVYLLLPRLATSLEAHYCLPLSGEAIKWIFITADVTTVLAQLAGTALTITFGDLVKIGKWIVTGGLWVQLAFFLTFAGMFLTFVRRAKRDGLLSGKASIAKWNAKEISVGYAMAAACALMLASRAANQDRAELTRQVRSIYRVAEYTSGANSALGQSETAFYILDGLMMLLLVITFHVVWPPNCLDRDQGTIPVAMAQRR